VAIRLFDLFRADEKADGYSRALQAARVRAAHQRSYFAPALFSLVPVETDLIGSMAVDSHWRLYYNDAWVATHTVEENASLLIHEVSHLLRDHEERRKAAGICERVAYKAGMLNVVFNAWCGLLLVGIAAWLLWELWSAVAPKPITDDFLKLLDDSFGRDWRSPRTWPWARVGWAYGFTLLGAASAVCMALLVSALIASSIPAKAPAVRVDTSQRFRFSKAAPAEARSRSKNLAFEGERR
jgi:hypothetical protein